MAKPLNRKIMDDRIFTAWFELITNRDMVDKNNNFVILTCPICHALFEAKNIFNSDIFPWRGKHPGDENTTVITEEAASIINERGSFCACSVTPIRVLIAEYLCYLVEENFNLGQK